MRRDEIGKKARITIREVCGTSARHDVWFSLTPADDTDARSIRQPFRAPSVRVQAARHLSL